MISPLGSPLGAERPRVELRPPAAVGSYGPEACELAALAGLPLEDWQAEGLNLMLTYREDGRWAAREYAEWLGRQQGKSTGIGVPRALAGLLLLGERMIMWSAHEVKTALEAFLQLRLAIERLGEPAGPNVVALDDGAALVKIVNNNGYEGFTLSDGRRMRFVARSKGSGRGFSGDCNIIDEAFAYTRAQQSALAPTQLARPNPQTVYLSSPPLRGDTEEGQVMFALAERAEVGDEKLGYRDWGLATTLDEVRTMPQAERTAFLDDRSRWAAALPALGRGRVTEESIDQLRREMSDLDFAREVLGCWPVKATAGRWTVVREMAWRGRAGLGEDDRPDEALHLAVAAAYPDAEFGSIALCGRRGGEVLAQVLEHRPGTSWVVERVAELRERHDFGPVVLDRKGPARTLIPDFEDAGIPLLHPSIEDVAQAAAMFHALVAGDDPELRHYDQPELAAALAAAQKRPLGDGWTWMRKGVADISPLEASTLAVWAVTCRASVEPWAVWA